MNNIGSIIVFVGCMVLCFVLGGKYYPVQRTEEIVLIQQAFDFALDKPIPGKPVPGKPTKPRIDTLRVRDTVIVVPACEDYDVEFVDNDASGDFYARVHVMPANLDARLDSLFIKKQKAGLDSIRVYPIKVVEYQTSDFDKAKWAFIGGLITYIFLSLSK